MVTCLVTYYLGSLIICPIAFVGWILKTRLLPAAFNLAGGLLKERRHLGFAELADVLKSHGCPVAGDHPYIYRQNTCLLAWVGMSRVFWMVAARLRRHPNVRIERVVDPRPSQVSPQLEAANRPQLHRSRHGAALVAVRIRIPKNNDASMIG
jgi:hypothetical protein